MAKLTYKNGITSVILRVKIMDSTSTSGGAKTGLTSASSGLIISTIADNEATPTVYAVASSNVETITTLGTFATPTTNKCRFKEVDATNHPGLYEIQIANARWAVSNARSLVVTVSGATGAAQVDAEIQLSAVDLNDSVRGGMTALPNAAAEASGGLITRGTSTGQLSVSSGAVIIQAGTSAGQLDFTSGVVKANVTQFGGTNATSSGGRPEVNLSHIAGSLVSTSTAQLGVNVVNIAGSAATPITAPTNFADLDIDGSGRVLLQPTQTGVTIPTVTTVNGLAANTVTASALANDAVLEFWTTALTEAYRATGATGTGAQILYEILQNIIEFAISGTTKTVKKLDGSTTAKTYTLNDSVNPTSITETT